MMTSTRESVEYGLLRDEYRRLSAQIDGAIIGHDRDSSIEALAAKQDTVVERMRVLRDAISLREAFRFFLEHAGYIVGHRAEGALALARAERKLTAGIAEGCLRVTYTEDLDGTVDGQHPAWIVAVEYVGSGGDGETIAALGGVDDPWGSYGRVLAANLALEAFGA